MRKTIVSVLTGMLALGAFATLSACENEHKTTRVINRDYEGDWRHDRDRRYDQDDHRYDRDDRNDRD